MIRLVSATELSGCEKREIKEILGYVNAPLSFPAFRSDSLQWVHLARVNILYGSPYGVVFWLWD